MRETRARAGAARGDGMVRSTPSTRTRIWRRVLGRSVGCSRPRIGVEGDLDILESRDLDRHLAAERQDHGVDGIGVERVGRRKAQRAVSCAIRVEGCIVQKRQRELRRERCSLAESVERNAGQRLRFGKEIGKLARLQVRGGEKPLAPRHLEVVGAEA